MSVTETNTRRITIAPRKEEVLLVDADGKEIPWVIFEMPGDVHEEYDKLNRARFKYDEKGNIIPGATNADHWHLELLVRCMKRKDDGTAATPMIVGQWTQRTQKELFLLAQDVNGIKPTKGDEDEENPEGNSQKKTSPGLP